MITTFFHPAAVQLLRLQSHGRGRRMWRRFCQPRRLVLSALACVLAVAWLGNAVMTIWLRETASVENLRALLSLGLVLYTGWHFAKAAFFRPESPFDWTPGESDVLAAMPLRPRDLVAHQLASVTVTTCLKAGLFTLLLLPDLRCVPLGLAGVVLAMLALELLRMAIDIATWGASRSAFLAYRATVVAALMTVGCAVFAIVIRADAFGGQLNVGEGLLARFLTILVTVNNSVVGYAALPLRPFVDLILADRITPDKVALTMAATGIVMGLGAAVVALYATMTRRVAQREKRHFDASRAPTGVLAGRNHSELGMRLLSIPRCGGAGALAWRQLVGAGRHWGSLLTAMIAPAVLASLPGFVIQNPEVAFLATTGTVAFYTFLLLPTALRFDFRRDLQRLAMLKGMPISPGAAAVGQTVAPVLIATVFQTAILAFAVAARSLPPQYLCMAMLVMLPLNVLVFALDNLIFLLYPYRLQQEGLEIFLRTMLTFTGKGLLFALGLAMMSQWGFVSADLTRGLAAWTGATINAYAVFVAGMVAGPALLAAIVLGLLAATYRNMNPIEDLQ